MTDNLTNRQTLSSYFQTGDIITESSMSDLITTMASLSDSNLQTFQGPISATSISGDGSGITGVTGEWDGSHTGNASIDGTLSLTNNLSVDDLFNYTPGATAVYVHNNLDMLGYSVCGIGQNSLGFIDGSRISINNDGNFTFATATSSDDRFDITAISAVSVSAVNFYGDGSNLTGIVGGGGGTAKNIDIVLVDIDTTVTTDATAGNFTYTIPPALSGLYITEVAASVMTTGASALTVDIYNSTHGANAVLSTPITVDGGEYTSWTAATSAVIAATYDLVTRGDRLRFDTTAPAATADAPKGLTMHLTFDTISVGVTPVLASFDVIGETYSPAAITGTYTEAGTAEGAPYYQNGIYFLYRDSDSGYPAWVISENVGDDSYGSPSTFTDLSFSYGATPSLGEYGFPGSPYTGSVWVAPSAVQVTGSITPSGAIGTYTKAGTFDGVPYYQNGIYFLYRDSGSGYDTWVISESLGTNPYDPSTWANNATNNDPLPGEGTYGPQSPYTGTATVSW